MKNGRTPFNPADFADFKKAIAEGRSLTGGIQNLIEDQPLTGADLARWCHDNPNLAASTIEGLRPPAQPTVNREALDALLAFRHGDTKHLTQEHARTLYAVLAAQPPAAPVETDAEIEALERTVDQLVKDNEHLRAQLMNQPEDHNGSSADSGDAT